MFVKKKRAPQPKGQGAAAAKQVTTVTELPVSLDEHTRETDHLQIKGSSGLRLSPSQV